MDDYVSSGSKFRADYTMIAQAPFHEHETVTPLQPRPPGPFTRAGPCEKRSVGGGVHRMALLITVLKIAGGLWTNSLGILSEALHSSST